MDQEDLQAVNPAVQEANGNKEVQVAVEDEEEFNFADQSTHFLLILSIKSLKIKMFIEVPNFNNKKHP